MLHPKRLKIFMVAIIAFQFLLLTPALASESEAPEAEKGFIQRSKDKIVDTTKAGIENVKMLFNGGGDEGDDAMGRNLEINFDELHQDVNAKYEAAQGLGMVSQFDALRELGQRFMEERKECTEKHQQAARSCLEHFSEHMINGTAAINGMLAVLNVSGVNDSCSTMGQAMNIAQASLTAYTAYCGTRKAGCGMSCVKARKTLSQIRKQASGLKNVCPPNPAPGQTHACDQARIAFEKSLNNLNRAYKEELAEDQIMSMAGKAKLCQEKYGHLLASGLAGITSVAMSLTEAKNCEEESRGTTDIAQSKKCEDPNNAQLPECICLANPEVPGCETGPTIRESQSAAEFDIAGGVDAMGAYGGSGANGAGDIDFGSDSGGFEMPDPREPASAGGAGPPMGGGSAGLSGGGGGGGGGGPAQEGEAKKKLNANILGGAGGGGGGRGGMGFGSSSGENYRAYLPGGAKDPNRGMAGQGANAWDKEVTGHGGKSNWDKIRDRYRDNSNSLLAK